MSIKGFNRTYKLSSKGDKDETEHRKPSINQSLNIINLGRLPEHPSQGQVRASTFPPQRLPIRNRYGGSLIVFRSIKH